MKRLQGVSRRSSGLAWEYIDRGFGRCVAAFASAQANKPQPEFEWFPTLEKLSVDVLMLKDTMRRWYLYCREDIEELFGGIDPYMLVGASMGGYGALMYGVGRKVRAFGPQTAISTEWRSANKDTRFAEFIPAGHDLEIEGDNFHIHYCQHNELDRLHAERTKARLYPHDCDSHKVAQKIDIGKYL